MKHLALALLAVLTACVADVPASDDERDIPSGDDWGQTASVTDDGYVPHAVTASRFGVFYEVSPDVLAAYQDPTSGLPQAADHAWIISQSLGTQHASRPLANAVHKRGDFYYAATFDLWKAYPSWQSDSDASLTQQAHAFRDQAIAAHADLFAFNEVPTGTPTSGSQQDKIATILRGLHDADAQGRRLQGVVFFTEAAGTPDNWSGPATAFYKAIDDTSIALVVEHYHSTGFICGQSEAALAEHFFALRTWLEASGDAAKKSIAGTKFTVLHSARYDAGPSGWAGADSEATTLADFQRDLSRAALVTRTTEGGYNRLAFGPVHSSMTEFGVQGRITALFRWHYAHTAPQSTETACIGGAAGNCTCQ
jgi:hypothetical protein|nr:hypothetical protein [Kofleriaceae bacterium]